MNNIKRNRIFSSASFCVSSATILFMPMFPRETDLLISNILAITFWGFFITGMVLTIIKAKKLQKKKSSAKGFLSLIKLFTTKQTKIIDIVLMASLLLLVFFTAFNIGFAQIIFIFFAILSAELHFVFNA